MISYIYKITNLVNNKIYIGQSINPNLKKFMLQKAMLKYGVLNFRLDIIEFCLIECVDSREKFWIKKLDSTNINIGYNITLGGKGFSGLKCSEEKKKYLSNLYKGRKISEETKKKISIANSGDKNGMFNRAASNKTRKKLSNFQNTNRSKRKPLTEEHKNKIREANKKSKLAHGSISNELKIKIFDMYKSCKYTAKKIAETVKLKFNTVIKIIRTLKLKFSKEKQHGW